MSVEKRRRRTAVAGTETQRRCHSGIGLVSDFTVKNAMLLICWLLLGAFPVAAESPDSVSATAEGNRLTELKTLLSAQGYMGVDSLFYRPEFELYSALSERFDNSPEKKGGETYLDSLKTGGEAAGAKTFEDEFAKYAKIIGLEQKKRLSGIFMDNYGVQLSESEAAYGVPREIIAAVLGIESDFGRVRLRYYAFNVYVSLYVYNYRADFALAQLKELINFSRKREVDMFALPSSYAGAVGAMQFLPYSLNRWFVGNDVTDMGATIASVANYLAYFIKQRGNIEDALRSYNPSRLYVRSVLELATYIRDNVR